MTECDECGRPCHVTLSLIGRVCDECSQRLGEPAWCRE